MDFEMNLAIIRDKSGNLRGFSIEAEGHTESEIFCDTFPQALIQRKETGADVVVKDGRLCLIHPACRFKGDCSFALDSSDAEELNDLLERQGRFTGIGFSIKQSLFSITAGFELSIADTEV